MTELLLPSSEIHEPVRPSISEPLSRTLGRLFRSDNSAWDEEVANIAECVAIGIGQDHNTLFSHTEEEHDMFALVTGSVARRWHIENPKNRHVGDILRSDSQKLAVLEEPIDPLHKHALEEFAVGPNDLDIRFFGKESGISMEQLTQNVARVLEEISFGTDHIDTYHTNSTLSPLQLPADSQTTASVILKQLKHKSALQVAINRPERTPFRIDISYIVNNWLEDFRMGQNQSTKQNVFAFLARPKQDHTQVKIMNDAFGFRSELKTLLYPSLIHRPVYSDPTQCVLAGLRLIRNELLWKSTNSDKEIHRYIVNDEIQLARRGIDVETIKQYRRELKRHMESLKKGDTPLDAYRVEEIIREAILCLTIDPEDAATYMAILGILDEFIPQHGLEGIEYRWDDYKKGAHKFPILDTTRTLNAEWNYIMKRLMAGSLLFEDITFTADDIPAASFYRAACEAGAISESPYQNNVLNLAHTFDLRRLQTAAHPAVR